MARKERLKATAHHEAGHAVAAWRQYVKFRYVTITPEEGSLGHLAHKFPKWFDPENGLGDKQRLRAESHIIISLAGQLAEAKFLGRHPRYGMHGDNENALNMALYFCGSMKSTEAYLRFCWSVTEDLVACNWREIESLAAALLETPRIKYEDAIEIIMPGSKSLRQALSRKPTQA